MQITIFGKVEIGRTLVLTGRENALAEKVSENSIRIETKHGHKILSVDFLRSVKVLGKE